VSVEHLVPQTPSRSEEHALDSESFDDDTIYQLGNVTLIEGGRNSSMSNSVWKEKKKKLKAYGISCPLNLEESFLFKEDKLTHEDIKKRSEQLIKEFKGDEMKLFDVDENQWKTIR